MAKAAADIRSLARAHTPTAIRTLAGIMQQPDAPAAARVSAAVAILDRGWGKPDATLILEDKRDAVDWTRDELVAFLNNARNGGERTVETNGRDPDADSVH